MQWMTAAEAEARWALGRGTVRNACNRGTSFQALAKMGWIRKSGKMWLVTDQAMEIQYGPEPTKK